MTNLDKYKKVFTKTFNVSNSKLESLKYNEINEWDSIGHMTLVAALEEQFKITMETDDVVDLSSFKKGKQILVERYKIEI
jgi:acyl carrier protein|tara:strand:+ start:560 stop:799 length:240 start_codon:yes stop_codon:yes gene_type:complete